MPARPASAPAAPFEKALRERERGRGDEEVVSLRRGCQQIGHSRLNGPFKGAEEREREKERGAFNHFGGGAGPGTGRALQSDPAVTLSTLGCATLERCSRWRSFFKKKTCGAWQTSAALDPGLGHFQLT